MIVLVTIALHLVLLHTVDGREVEVNPDQVTALQAGVPNEPNKLLTEKVSCVIGLTNGKFISVRETCDEVREKLEAAR